LCADERGARLLGRLCGAPVIEFGAPDGRVRFGRALAKLFEFVDSPKFANP
jgi:hypothetical protein